MAGMVWAAPPPGVLDETHASVRAVMAVQNEVTPDLMKLEGILGTAVGLNDNDELAIAVFVDRDSAKVAELVRGLPPQIRGKAVKLELTDKFRAFKPGGSPSVKPAPINPAVRFARPVPIGVSTGHPAITAGTIGCRVVDAAGNKYALSNNHVYADENKGPLGVLVLQPGPYDGGTLPNDGIGILSAFEPIRFDGSANYIDAAIALSDASTLGKATPANGYGTPGSTTANATIRMAVQKYGRTTVLTKGKVAYINVAVNVGYDSGVARFENQIIVTPGTFSAGGDSGSLIVTADTSCKPVGLLFAGSSSYTIANPINSVLSRFSVTVDGK